MTTDPQRKDPTPKELKVLADWFRNLSLDHKEPAPYRGQFMLAAHYLRAYAEHLGGGCMADTSEREIRMAIARQALKEIK